MSIEKLNIYLENSNQKEFVGQLILNKKEILFKYSQEFLDNGFNLSPLLLKFDNSIQSAKPQPFKGLFGVFADSLPDAWGTLLMKRQLNSQNIPLESLNMLDQLSMVSQNSLGALTYKPSKAKEEKSETVQLDALESGIKTILSGESNQIVDQLFSRGGSPGGARPKIYVGYNPITDELIHGISHLPKDFEHWIVKFAATIDSPDIAQIEMAYHKMALDCNIQMMPCKLFKGQSGKVYFGTKRFDRIGNEKIHMVSAAGMFHDDYENSQMDYGTLLYETSELINHALVQEQVFRRAVFNVYAHNRDDHSKNFAYLMDGNGKWTFAPAYDLTFSSSSQGYHSTKCAGNDFDPGEKELLELADQFSIKNGKFIIAEIKKTIENWPVYADTFLVTKNSMSTIQKTLTAMLSR